MAKLTKNSYKRKVILFGVLLFMSIALISTGFAAWIMSTNANYEDDGNVSVGTVTDGSIKLTDVALSTDSIKFEPLEEDTTGRVRNDGTNFESLQIVVTGKVSPRDILGELTIELQMEEKVKTALQAAADKNYIILPECANSAVDLKTLGDACTENEEGGYDFTYTIEFKWGSFFQNLNPGEYYDENETGTKVSDEEVKKILKELRATIYGYDVDASDEIINAAVGPTFKVVINARAN